MKTECFHGACDENLDEEMQNKKIVKKNSQKAN